MSKFLSSIFGQKERSTRSSVTSNEARTLRAKLVRDWKELKNEYEQLNENSAFQSAERMIEITSQLRMIEQGCVVSHVMDKPAVAPEEAITRWQGKSMARALNRDFDGSALVGLSAKLVGQFNVDYPFLAKQFLDIFEAELGRLDESEANSLRAGVSELIWLFLIAYYEIGVARELGQSHNIFVTANIGNVFAGLRYKNLLEQGYEEIDRVAVEEAVTNFVTSNFENITFYFDGTDSYLAQYYLHRAQSAYFTDEMGITLDQIFADFVVSNKPLFKSMLDGD